MLSIWPGYFVWDSLQHQSNVLHVEVQSSSLKLELYDNGIVSKHSEQTNKPPCKDAPGLPTHSRSQNWSLKIKKVNQAPVKRNSDTEQQSSVSPSSLQYKTSLLRFESPVGWQKRIFLPSIMHQSSSDFINVFWWKSALNHVG